MPDKNVQMPDGSVVAFPDNMDDATIHAEGLKYLQSKQPQPKPQQTLPQNINPLANIPSQPYISRDALIDTARPAIAGGVADVAGAAAGGVTAGFGALPAYGGAYALTDAALQYLKKEKPESFGSAVETGAIQAGLSKLLGGLTKGVFKAGKSFNTADQPEIYNFSPTTSQAAAVSGLPKFAMAAKALEDLNIDAKKAALDKAGGVGFSEALKFARQQYYPGMSMSPQENAKFANRFLPFGEGSFTPIKLNDLGREVTPIKFIDEGRQVTPIKILQNETEVTPIKIKPGEEYQPLRKGKPFQPQTEPIVIPGQTKTISAPGTQTLAGEPTTIPGGKITIQPKETRTLPGGQIQVQAGTPQNKIFDSTNKLDNLIRDPKKLEDVLSTSQANGLGYNVRQTLGGYHFSKIMNDAVIERDLQGNVLRLDPAKITEAWTDPAMQDSLKTLYNAPTRANMEQFFNNIVATQDKMQAPQMAKKLWLMRGGIGLSAGLITGSLAGSAGVGSAATAAAYLTAPQVGRLLANTKYARLFVNLAGGEPLGYSDAMASKLIARALQGEVIALVDSDGNKQPMLVKGQELVPLR